MDVLWDPVRDRSRSRLLFIARPGAEVRGAIEALVSRRDMSSRASGVLFPVENWHQSVSDRYVDTPAVRETLLKAGALVRAPAFTVSLDRLHSARNQRGQFNWDIRSQRGCDELKTLIGAINAAIAAQGFPGGGGHSPHITLSYGADASLACAGPITPIPWMIDTIELVAGGGQPYRYTMLQRWSLAPAASHPIQISLL